MTLRAVSTPPRPVRVAMLRYCQVQILPPQGAWSEVWRALQVAAGHGYRPLRGVATSEDVYKLTCVRGPSGILVMLAEALAKVPGPGQPSMM